MENRKSDVNSTKSLPKLMKNLANISTPNLFFMKNKVKSNKLSKITKNKKVYLKNKRQRNIKVKK